LWYFNCAGVGVGMAAATASSAPTAKSFMGES
jgi:hypothetical protein